MGHNTTAAIAVVQFGFAINFDCCIEAKLTSGTLIFASNLYLKYLF